MRPQHITAENVSRAHPTRPADAGASMRPQHITAENDVNLDLERAA